MPSSTSSSRERAAGAGWPRALFAGVIIAVATVAGAEILWREQGHRPSIVDGPALWAYQRDRVYEHGRQTVALLGMSRMQLGLAIGTLRDRLPGYEIVQLAVAGRHPIAALRDLADDERFVGIVICAVNPAGLQRNTRHRQDEYVEFYHRNRSLNTNLNRRIGWFLQERLTVLNPQIRLLEIASEIFKSRSLPEPSHVTTHFDRSRSADFMLVDVESYRKRLIQRAGEIYEAAEQLPPDEWIEEALETTPMVERIRRRGGRVVFIHFSTAGEHYELDERYYPRREYWNRFAARTPAVAIHTHDVPSLSRFNLPDASHLDYRDTAAFTSALVDELIRLGVIPVQ